MSEFEDELRFALAREPVTATDPELFAAAVEADLRSLASGPIIGAPDPELHGYLAEAMARVRAEADAIGAMSDVLRGKMREMGYVNAQIERVVQTVRVVDEPGDGIALCFTGPPRVHAAMEAILAGDFAVAHLIVTSWLN